MIAVIMEYVIVQYRKPPGGLPPHSSTPTSVTMNSSSNSSLFTLENFSLVAVTTTVCSSAWILLTALFA